MLGRGTTVFRIVAEGAIAVTELVENVTFREMDFEWH